MEHMYSLLNKGMDQRPAYGFSHRLRAAVEKDEKTPSPLDYYAEKVDAIGSQSTKGFSFGGHDRFRKVRKDPGPGPGEYTIPDEFKRKKKKKQKKKKSEFYDDIFRADTPEPETKEEAFAKYKKNFVHKKGFSFGSRIEEHQHETTPGPGKKKYT
jgi:hypothetical protein